MKQADIERLLPKVYQYALPESAPLRAIVAVMESHHAPVETVLENLHTYFNPYTAPDAFVTFLAKWVDLDRFFETTRMTGNNGKVPHEPLASGHGRLRELIAAASFLSQWRGTALGLQSFLEIVTGERGFLIEENIVDDNGNPCPFHFEITAPGSVVKYSSLIERIIEQEKPAYVSYQLKFTD